MNYHCRSILFRALPYMELHFREDIGLDEIATYAGYDPRYFNSLFKTYFGETVGEYLRFLRMEEAKRLLLEGHSVGDVAKQLSYKPRGFFHAFQKTFGISPSEFAKGGTVNEPYVKRYEWRNTANSWGKGDNPTSDGLWEFSYYNQETDSYDLMDWYAGKWFFGAPDNLAPFLGKNYFCRNREGGNSIHPGRVTPAIRSFIAPHDGTVQVFFIVGRDSPIYKKSYPSKVQLYHNDIPLGEPLYLKNIAPHKMTATLCVRKNDKIRFRVESGGNQRRCSVNLYRQMFLYTQIDE